LKLFRLAEDVSGAQTAGRDVFDKFFVSCDRLAKDDECVEIDHKAAGRKPRGFIV
jgi:archaeosine-15-forming tRNA-guanine transglycosylase